VRGSYGSSRPSRAKSVPFGWRQNCQLCKHSMAGRMLGTFGSDPKALFEANKRSPLANASNPEAAEDANSDSTPRSSSSRLLEQADGAVRRTDVGDHGIRERRLRWSRSRIVPYRKSELTCGCFEG